MKSPFSAQECGRVQKQRSSSLHLALRGVALVLVLVFGLGLAPAASAQDAGKAPVLPNIYRSTTPVYTISYPFGWTVTELGPESAILAAPSSLSVLFMARQDDFYLDEDLDLTDAMTDGMVAAMLASSECMESNAGERGKFIADNGEWMTVEVTCKIDSSVTMQAVVYISARSAEDAVYMFMGATLDLLFPAQRPTYDAMVASVTFPVDGASTSTSALADAMNDGSAIAEVKVSALNVRQGPGANNSVVAVVHLGDKLTVVGPADNGWLPIITPDGSAGWVSGSTQYVTMMVSSPPQLVQESNPALTPTPAPTRRPQLQPTASPMPTPRNAGGTVQVTVIYPQDADAPAATYAFLSYYDRTAREWINRFILTDADNRATFEIPIEPDGASAVFTPGISMAALKANIDAISAGSALGFRIAADSVDEEIVLRIDATGGILIDSGALQMWGVDE